MYSGPKGKEETLQRVMTRSMLVVPLTMVPSTKSFVVLTQQPFFALVHVTKFDMAEPAVSNKEIQKREVQFMY